MMGRKGIGKLASFGIAQKLSLFTISRHTRLCYWIVIDLQGLLAESQEETEQQQYSYKPDVVCDGVTVDNVPLEHDSNGHIAKFLSATMEGGTLIVMDNLSLKRTLNEKSLMESIGRRFTVTLLREDFKVHVNDTVATEKQALPDFAFRIPSEGFAEEIVQINGQDRIIKHWVGFVEQAEWPQDQAGVGIYAHGKIAQDRPFVFGLKGREISTRYMYGVIEADWLDELDEDVVSTDRTSIDWEHNDTEVMHEWGNKLVGQWIVKYRKHQKEINESNIINKIENLPEIPKVTQQERDAIKDMVCNMSPKIHRDENLQNEVITQITSAWTHRPTRSILNSLWDRLKDDRLSESEFISILDDIYKHLVPESLSLSVTVA